ncbi:MAG: hypothetical protein Q9183_006644 [Haloplaca sp. 2 TL-2023]
MDKYYRQALATGGRTAETKPKAPRAPKQIQIHDYQFFPARLQDIQDRETAFFRKEIGYKVPLPDREDMDEEEKEAERALEQQEIDDAVELTDAERAEKETLSEQGFATWNRRDFQQFINGSAKHGRNNHAGIAEEVDGKNEKEVKEYAKAFWQHYTDIAEYTKYINTIEAGEEKTRKLSHQSKMLRRKMEQYRVPLQQLKLNYSVSTTNKKVYTEEEDRFLLVMLDRFGIDGDKVHERIREEIRESPLFRFDWFFMSRSAVEIGRRCTTLLTTVAREFETADTNMTNGHAKSRVRNDEEDAEEDGPPPKKAKNGVKVCSAPLPYLHYFADKIIQNKQLDAVKNGSKSTTAETSRASSVATNGVSPKPKGKGKKK